MKTAAWVVSAQVLNWMLQGHIRKEVATHLGLSIHTAAEYISELYKRFDVNSQTSLVRRFLVADGVLSPLTIRQTGTWRTGTAYSTYKKHPLRCGAFTHSQLSNGSYHKRPPLRYYVTSIPPNPPSRAHRNVHCVLPMRS